MAKRMIRGENLEDKISSIDQHLWSLSRKVYRHATVVVPAIPMGSFIDVLPMDGTIFKFLVPADGSISRALMYVERVPKDVKPSLSVNVLSKGKTITHILPFKIGLNSLQCNFALSGGDLVAMTVSDSALIGGIWMSLLYEIQVPRGCQQQFLVDEILSKYEKEEEDGEQASSQIQAELDRVLSSNSRSSDTAGVSDLLRGSDSTSTDEQTNNALGSSGDGVQNPGDGCASISSVEEAVQG